MADTKALDPIVNAATNSNASGTPAGGGVDLDTFANRTTASIAAGTDRVAQVEVIEAQASKSDIGLGALVGLTNAMTQIDTSYALKSSMPKSVEKSTNEAAQGIAKKANG